MVVKNKQGFSLIELAIVIVIMGLLVASITVGKDLIKASELRGLISQIYGFDMQISTFRSKYNALPGDIKNANKRGLGVNNGDGDGMIEDGTDDTTPDSTAYEISYFWEHLNKAGFADGAYDGDPLNGAVGETFPRAKHGGGIVAYGVDGKNYFHIGIDDSANGSPKTLKFVNSFIPEDAYSIDYKLDDGFPLKGKVVARSASCPSDPNGFSCANTPITVDSGGASQVPGDTCVLQAEASQNDNADEYDFETSVSKCQLRILLK
jgi:prepilin-type N-terminal cleavage/methylation domain-containing protein